MTTRKDDDLSREAGHDKTALSYDEAEAEAKRAARVAMKAAPQGGGRWLLDYMNEYHRTLEKLGHVK
jgi:hypothetical protein